MLTSQYLLEQGAQQGAQASSSDQKAEGTVPKWALLKSDPADVKIISSFQSLLADQDKNAKLFQMRGRVAVCLQALADVLPSYCDEDFHLVARQND